MKTNLLIALSLILLEGALSFSAEQPKSTALSVPAGQDSPGLITSVPRTMSYQGVLKDGAGQPVADQDVMVTFRIFDQAAGGTAIWSSQATIHTDSQGMFAAMLENLNLPFDADYYLELEVDTGEPLSPRQVLNMVPYAARSDTSDYALNAESNWTVSNSVLYTITEVGVARGGSGNSLYGISANTMINLGVGSTAGEEGQDRSYCTVSGGSDNSAAGDWATVGGGESNTASNTYATVGGGRANTASLNWATVSGGDFNTASNYFATVSGGGNNVSSNDYCFVSGGYNNQANGNFSGVAGGSDNIAEADYSIVSGGYENAANGIYSFSGGGHLNVAGGDRSFVGGGENNVAAGAGSVAIGGSGNSVESSGENSLVFGRNVSVSDPYRAAFFESSFPGRMSINRDDDDGAMTGILQVGTNNVNGNGAYLSPGGTWMNGSSRTFKENFTSFEGNELLGKISGLSLTTYNYRNSTEKHVGPVAEEFVDAFDTGVIRADDGKRDDRYLSAGDVAGVALAGVQELIAQNRQLRETIEDLQRQIDELRNR